jgi:hypothetical protein
VATSVAVRGIVTAVRKQPIPKMYVTRVESEDGTVVEFDTHEDLVLYNEKEQVEIMLVKNDTPPEYSDDDYVVRAIVASIRENEEGGREYLLSAGGLLFILSSPRELPLEPMDKIYIRVSRVPK